MEWSKKENKEVKKKRRGVERSGKDQNGVEKSRKKWKGVKK